MGNFMIMTKKGTFHQYSSNQKISLEEIIVKYPQFTLGIEQDTVYGEIQPIIDKYLKLKKEKFFKRPGVGSHHALFRMLKSDRVQYTLVFPSEIYWIKKFDSKEINFPFELYDISEFKNFYGNVYTVCSKNEFGKKVINQVNQIISENEEILRNKHKEGIDFWMPKEISEKLMKYYDLEKKSEKLGH